MLLTLSTGHTIGLGLSALVFVAFSIVVAMVVPCSRADFPGKALPSLILATAVLFVGMLAAVEIFGAEKEEPRSESAPVLAQS